MLEGNLKLFLRVRRGGPYFFGRRGSPCKRQEIDAPGAVLFEKPGRLVRGGAGGQDIIQKKKRTAGNFFGTAQFENAVNIDRAFMLAEESPVFANWDQDATAVEDDYASQDPGAVVDDLSMAADRFAQAVVAIPDDAWDRMGLRGDGASFTIESFIRYLLHDPIHHLTDVTGDRWV